MKHNIGGSLSRTKGGHRMAHHSNLSGSIRNWKALPVLAALVTVLGSVLIASPGQAGATTPADQGVTPTTISVGVPYVNFVALRPLGVTINEGSFPDAYGAIIANMNAHGGVDGRKIVVHYNEFNPSVPASVTAACSTLTEDDHIFIALSPVYPDCYQQNHGTLVIAGSLPGTLPANVPPDFSLSPPDANFDPIQFAAFDKRGAFKGKKVGIFYAADSDKPEVDAVQADLKKLHVDVVTTAEDSVEATDAVASDQDVATIAERFKTSGVNLVVGVGGAGSTTWPRALLDNQSTYKPPWIATSESSLQSYVESAKTANPYLDNVLAALPTPTNYQEWKDPAIQKCAAIVHKAYPSDTINPPPNPTAADAAKIPATAVSVIQACQDLALFAKIANTAGKKLTVASFTKAGYSIKNVAFPGTGGPVSFGNNQAYAVGPTTVVTFSPKSGAMVPASSSAQ
jgi:hypothetical protein